MMHRHHDGKRSPRRGAILVALLICLLIVLMISAASVRVLVLQHRVARDEPQQLQAAWLADSAVDRALARLAKDAGYEGETWEVALDDDAVTKGIAVIVVKAVEADPKQRTISVEARWPDEPVFRVMEQREHTVDLTDSGES